MSRVAALYVLPDGPYAGLDDVEVWDEARDARKYDGPWPVIAHPPCARWCRLAGLVEARWGHKRGEDDGCFAAALAAVRRWGGILEHPAYSDAWPAHDLNRPPTGGGWVNADWQGGWTCYVEQSRYGHPAKKATWLYAAHIELPDLRWGHQRDIDSEELVSWCGNHTKKRFARIGDLPSNGATDWDHRRRLSPKEASATPAEFRDELLGAVQNQSKRQRSLTPEPLGMARTAAVEAAP